MLPLVRTVTALPPEVETVNGIWTSQAIAKPSMPRSIPVPIRPAADSRMYRSPRSA
jgi:hypothetical protein